MPLTKGSIDYSRSIIPRRKKGLIRNTVDCDGISENPIASIGLQLLRENRVSEYTYIYIYICIRCVYVRVRACVHV